MLIINHLIISKKPFIMKKTSFITACMLLVALNFSYANIFFPIGSSSALIESKPSEKTFTLNLANIGKDVMRIEIRDENNAVLSLEQVQNKARYSKKFNLTQLPIGTYQLTLSNSTSKIIQPITVSKTAVLMDEKLRIENYKPYLKFSNGKLDLNALNTSDLPVVFSIRDSGDQIVFEEKIKDTQAISKRYNLSDLPVGTYSTEVRIGTEVYVDYFTK
jgi:hypothetical protein